MMILRCVIVDDEPLSRDVIEEFIQVCPELELVGSCSDALEAGELLKQNETDLLFLDINMPKLSGISFIKTLSNPPMVIFVTAYPQYAVDGFEVNAVDYLVKPVAFERFRAAVNKVLERLENALDKQQIRHIMVRANKKNYRLEFDDILYLEAKGDYVKFKTKDSSLMVHGTLKHFLLQLPENEFIRIHKSFVISLNKVVFLEGNRVKIGDEKLPVSLNYKDDLLLKLG